MADFNTLVFTRNDMDGFLDQLERKINSRNARYYGGKAVLRILELIEEVENLAYPPTDRHQWKIEISRFRLKFWRKLAGLSPAPIPIEPIKAVKKISEQDEEIIRLRKIIHDNGICLDCGSFMEHEDNCPGNEN